MGNFQPFHDLQSLWSEYYKTGIQLWLLSPRPKIYDEDGEELEKDCSIHAYAYAFAETSLDDFERKWGPLKKYLTSEIPLGISI